MIVSDAVKIEQAAKPVYQKGFAAYSMRKVIFFVGKEFS